MFSTGLRKEIEHRLGRHYVRLMGEIDAQYQQGGAASLDAVARFREEWEQVKLLWTNLLADPHPASRAICTGLAVAVENSLTVCVAPSECVAQLKPTLAVAGLDTPFEERLSILYQLGKVYNIIGDNAEARAYFDEALTLALANGDQRYLLRIYNGIAELLLQASQLKEAMSYCERVLDPESGAGDEQRADALRCIGRSLNQLREYDRARPVFEDAIHAYERTDNLLGLAQTYISLATALMQTGDLGGARERLKQSLRIGRQLNHYGVIADSMNSLGVLARFAGELDEARYYYAQTLEISEIAEDKVGYGNGLNNMGTILYRQGEYNRAIEYFERALALRQAINEQVGVITTISNLCQMRNIQGKFRDTLAFLSNYFNTLRQAEGRPQSKIRIIAHATRALAELGSDARTLIPLVGFVEANQVFDSELLSFIEPAEQVLCQQVSDAEYQRCRAQGQSLTIADCLDVLEPLVAAVLSVGEQ